MIVELPFRLGYFLELRDVTFRDMPGRYRGVDRLWFTPVIGDDGNIVNASDELREIWERYFDAEYQSDLNTDRVLAQSLAAALAQHSVFLEVIYTEILRQPDNVHDRSKEARMLQMAEHWYTIHNALGRRPDDIAFLGYDVSFPIPTFHSAIFQPGLDKEALSVPALLNRNGLIASIDDALMVCREANAMDYGPYPFCVLGVWTTV